MLFNFFMFSKFDGVLQNFINYFISIRSEIDFRYFRSEVSEIRTIVMKIAG